MTSEQQDLLVNRIVELSKEEAELNATLDFYLRELSNTSNRPARRSSTRGKKRGISNNEVFLAFQNLNDNQKTVLSSQNA